MRVCAGLGCQVSEADLATSCGRLVLGMPLDCVHVEVEANLSALLLDVAIMRDDSHQVVGALDWLSVHFHACLFEL